MGKIKVAIIGVGNCASSLVQGVYKYGEASENGFIPGLMHTVLGGYHVGDIEFVAAFDIDKNKVGKDLGKAIYAPPNNTVTFHDVPRTGVKVMRGMTHDGIGKYISDKVKKAPGDTVDVAQVLKDTGADVVINYLPVGSEEATTMVRRPGAGGGHRFHQLHSRLHSHRGLLAEEIQRQERTYHRGRHQVAGWSHHHTSYADPSIS